MNKKKLGNTRQERSGRTKSKCKFTLLSTNSEISIDMCSDLTPPSMVHIDGVGANKYCRICDFGAAPLYVAVVDAILT